MKYSAEGLRKAGLKLTPPFAIDVALDPVLEPPGEPAGEPAGERADEGTNAPAVIEFKSLARVLPGRRVSGLAEFQDESHFVKVFLGPQARRYWRREMLGAQWLANADVPSPALLRQGAMAGEGGVGYVCLFAPLAQARTVFDDDGQAMAEIVDLVATMHQAGLLQSDVHLGNFLRNGDAMYAVDTDSIRRAQLLRVHFANLGMLLAQRRPTFDVEIDAMWDRYAASRGEYVQGMGSGAQLKQIVKKQRAERVRRYLRKTLRECTAFRHRKTFRLNVLCDRALWQQKDLQRLCLFPATVFDEGIPIKLGNSATLVRVTLDGRSYIVKRYNVKSIPHRVRRWFKRRARNAWMNGHLLSFLGIPSARPVALIENRLGWFVGACYLVMPDCGARSLDQVLSLDPNQFDEVAPQIIAILKQLAAAGLEHGDLKASNFVLRDGEVALIDFDSLRRGGNRGDIDRFLRNWHDSEELLRRWRELLFANGLLDQDLNPQSTRSAQPQRLPSQTQKQTGKTSDDAQVR